MYNIFINIKNSLLIIIIVANIIVSQRTKNEIPVDYRNSSGDSNCPPMKEWPALNTKAINFLILPLENIIIHHTLGKRCYNYEICSTIVKNIQNYSMGKGNCFDIKYNFLIGEDGNIYKGSDWFHPGCHTIGYDDTSIGIAFIGDFTETLPNAKALENAKKLISCGLKNNFLDENYKLYGGKQLDLSTKSPGLLLFNEIKIWKQWTSTT